MDLRRVLTVPLPQERLEAESWNPKLPQPVLLKPPVLLQPQEMKSRFVSMLEQ